MGGRDKQIWRFSDWLGQLQSEVKLWTYLSDRGSENMLYDLYLLNYWYGFEKINQLSLKCTWMCGEPGRRHEIPQSQYQASSPSFNLK